MAGSTLRAMPLRVAPEVCAMPWTGVDPLASKHKHPTGYTRSCYGVCSPPLLHGFN
jgi:hypothetical protein